MAQFLESVTVFWTHYFRHLFLTQTCPESVLQTKSVRVDTIEIDTLARQRRLSLLTSSVFLSECVKS